MNWSDEVRFREAIRRAERSTRLMWRIIYINMVVIALNCVTIALNVWRLWHR